MLKSKMTPTQRLTAFFFCFFFFKYKYLFITTTNNIEENYKLQNRN